MGIEIATLLRTARELSAVDFASKYPSFFILVPKDKAAGGALDISFRTGSLRHRDSLDGPIPVAAIGTIFAVVKSGRNPFRDRVSVGRAPNCDVVLRHTSVSKLHAHVHGVETGPLQIADSGSKNGTRLNGQRLLADRPEPLESGDLVEFGSVSTQILDAPSLHRLLRRVEKRAGAP